MTCYLTKSTSFENDYDYADDLTFSSEKRIYKHSMIGNDVGWDETTTSVSTSYRCQS